MKTLTKKSTSFANPCGHSEGWWRSFFRKCHALGILEHKLCNLAKSNQHYAIMAIYTITWKGQTVINNDEPVMVLDSEEDIVRRKKSPQNKSSVVGFTKSRCAKGGRIIDRLRELLNSKENWRNVESKNDYLFPGIFSTVSNQHLIFVPDIDKIKPNRAAEDLLWRDIQLSRGKMNLPRDLKVIIDGKQETLRYRVAPCAGVKRCPENDCNYTVPIKEHHQCPRHNIKLVKDANCSVYIEHDQRRWCGGLIMHPKKPCANLHTHAVPPPSSFQSPTIAALRDAVTRCPSLTPQSVSQGVGVGYMLPLADKAACNTDRIRYQLKKAQGPKLDPNMVIARFEEIANEIDEVDERGAGPLAGGASIVEVIDVRKIIQNFALDKHY